MAKYGTLCIKKAKFFPVCHNVHPLQTRVFGKHVTAGSHLFFRLYSILSDLLFNIGTSSWLSRNKITINMVFSSKRDQLDELKSGAVEPDQLLLPPGSNHLCVELPGCWCSSAAQRLGLTFSRLCTKKRVSKEKELLKSIHFCHGGSVGSRCNTWYAVHIDTQKQIHICFSVLKHIPSKVQ